MAQVVAINAAPKRGRQMTGTKNGGLDPLKGHIGDLVNLSAAMMVMAEMAPDRMSASQMIFFLAAASADLAGKQPTYSEVREALGDDINRTLHTTYRVVLEPSRIYPKALGWLSRTQNPNDNREYFLKLTPRGREVLKEVLKALGRDINSERKH